MVFILKKSSIRKETEFLLSFHAKCMVFIKENHHLARKRSACTVSMQSAWFSLRKSIILQGVFIKKNHAFYKETEFLLGFHAKCMVFIKENHHFARKRGFHAKCMVLIKGKHHLARKRSSGSDSMQNAWFSLMKTIILQGNGASAWFPSKMHGFY